MIAEFPRRGAAALLTAVALTTTACAAGGPPAPDAPPEASGPCAAGELPSLQAGSHLLGDTEPPVPYSSVPATSGWHASGLPPEGVLEDPIDDPHLVSILEGGGAAAVYDPARVSDDDVSRLEELAEGSYAGRLSVAPYAGDMDAPVTLTAWGVLQGCDAADADAIATFVLQFSGRTEREH